MLELLDTEATELERSSAPVEIAPLGSLEGAAGEWRDLAERSRNIFSTWEWARTWWVHYGAGHERRLFACRSPEGRPLAILPLSRAAIGPLRALRFSATAPATCSGRSVPRTTKSRPSRDWRGAAVDGRLGRVRG
jgi:CelD/BcsL family acetyltransferase involved in cellulose biosynthesis